MAGFFHIFGIAPFIAVFIIVCTAIILGVYNSERAHVWAAEQIAERRFREANPWGPVYTEEPVMGFPINPITAKGLPCFDMALPEYQMKEQAVVLQQVIARESLKVSISDAYNTPFGLMFELRKGSQARVQEVLDAQDAIETAFGASVCFFVPIPGTESIGLRINSYQQPWIGLGKIMRSKTFVTAPSKLTAAIGMGEFNEPIVLDFEAYPHLLITGARDSGKSELIHSILVSFLYKANPRQARFLLIDTRGRKLSAFDHLPFMRQPAIRQREQVAEALEEAEGIITRRLEWFGKCQAADLAAYNEKVEEADRLPEFFLVIDDLEEALSQIDQADELLYRLLDTGKPAGVHLILALAEKASALLSSKLLARIPAKMALHMKEEESSVRLIGYPGADGIANVGEFLLSLNDESRPIHGQAAVYGNGSSTYYVPAWSPESPVSEEEEYDEADGEYESEEGEYDETDGEYESEEGEYDEADEEYEPEGEAYDEADGEYESEGEEYDEADEEYEPNESGYDGADASDLDEDDYADEAVHERDDGYNDDAADSYEGNDRRVWGESDNDCYAGDDRRVRYESDNRFHDSDDHRIGGQSDNGIYDGGDLTESDENDDYEYDSRKIPYRSRPIRSDENWLKESDYDLPGGTNRGVYGWSDDWSEEELNTTDNSWKEIER